MADLIVMQIAKSIKGLTHNQSSLSFRQVLPLSNEEKQLSSLTESIAIDKVSKLRKKANLEGNLNLTL